MHLRNTLLYRLVIRINSKPIVLLLMEINPRGFKLRTVIDRFAWDLMLILQHALSSECFDSEQVKLQVLMTLSDVHETENKPFSMTKVHATKYSNRTTYVKELLFRDFSASKEAIWHRFNLPATATAPSQIVRIHDEAITYLSGVLERRLTLAQNLKEKPGNLHTLFIRFAKHSVLHPNWRRANAVRCLVGQTEHTAESYFARTALTLATLVQRLGTAYSDISHRRREQYGPIWLQAGMCQTEMPEELSLFDAFEALPLALNTNFIADADLQKSLVRVLDALNERYKLLRSVGLCPLFWLDKAKPSIAVLNDLKQLRKDAGNLMNEGKSVGLQEAFRKAFESKMDNEQRKKIADSQSFDDFSRTEYGREMMNYFTLSLDQEQQDDFHDAIDMYEIIPGAEPDEDMLQSLFEQLDNEYDWVQLLIDTHPELFDEVTIMFFHEAIGKDCALIETNRDQGLLRNKQFLKLIDKNPKYRRLNQEDLIDLLIKQANHIIEQGLSLSASHL